MVVKMNVWSGDKWVLMLILNLFHYYILWESSLKAVALVSVHTPVVMMTTALSGTFLWGLALEEELKETELEENSLFWGSVLQSGFLLSFKL